MVRTRPAPRVTVRADVLALAALACVAGGYWLCFASGRLEVEGDLVGLRIDPVPVASTHSPAPRPTPPALEAPALLDDDASGYDDDLRILDEFEPSPELPPAPKPSRPPPLPLRATPPPTPVARVDGMVSPAYDAMRREGKSFALAVAQPPKGNRTKLLFKHFPKAGGTFSRAFFEKAVPGVTVKGEAASVAPGDRRNRFVVSGLREPCSWYLSLWSFGTQALGGLHKQLLLKDADAFTLVYNASALRENSSAYDAAVFRRFLTNPYTEGLFSARLLSGLTEKMSVDCWVDTAAMVDDSRGCLRAFEAQGGAVNWAALDAFLDSPGAGKQNSIHHGACDAMVDPETRAWLEAASFDAPAYAYFGWPGGCCARGASRRSGHNTNLDTT